MTPPLLTLLTDFGLDDYYVAAVKGTVLRLAPESRIVDLSHQVAPGDVEGGAFLLAAAVPSFPAGAVHLAVVDPGVGSARRILAVESGGARLVGPDNGLLTPFLDAGARVRSVERAGLFLPAPGDTFHGRDRFAPLAAHLLAGGTAAELGPEVDDPVRLAIAPPRREGGRLSGRVAHVDRYGNLVTDLPSAWVPEGASCRAQVGGRAAARLVSHYQELAPGEPGIVPGSLGTLELSLRGESLARRWGLGRGAAVEVEIG